MGLNCHPIEIIISHHHRFYWTMIITFVLCQKTSFRTLSAVQIPSIDISIAEHATCSRRVSPTVIFLNIRNHQINICLQCHRGNPQKDESLFAHTNSCPSLFRRCIIYQANDLVFFINIDTASYVLFNCRNIQADVLLSKIQNKPARMY